MIKGAEGHGDEENLHSLVSHDERVGRMDGRDRKEVNSKR